MSHRKWKRAPASSLRIIAHCSLLVAVAAPGGWAAAAEYGIEPSENIVLDNQPGTWRVFMQWKTPELVAADGTAKPLLEEFDPKRHTSRADLKPVPLASTPDPPAGWTGADFDDSVWPRREGQYGPPTDSRDTLWNPAGAAALALVCLRGTFDVKDVQACRDLRLSVVYYGGVVVSVNGKQIQRAHLPKGDLTPATPAERYPEVAYTTDVRPDEQRARILHVFIRAETLRKGINVVTVEVHRAPIHEMVQEGKAALWPHALVKRATMRSAFGMTPREAVVKYDAPPKVVRQPGPPVLDTTLGHWRAATRWKTAELVNDDGAVRPLMARPRTGDRLEEMQPLALRATTAPPAGWIGPDFDDADWARIRGGVVPNPGYASIWNVGNAAELSLICARGRFGVTDPAACRDLEVTLDYHGGAAVYVNGIELARGHLPEGPLTADTLAVPYEKAAYFNPNGFLLPPAASGDFADFVRQHRVRTLTVPIPSSALRKGTNVVAVAVHRAPVLDAYLSGRFQQTGYQGVPGPWGHAALLSAAVRWESGRSGDGMSAVAPPGGDNRPMLSTDFPGVSGVKALGKSRFWAQPVQQRLLPDDFGDPNEGPQTVRIVGARGGAFCGLAVVEAGEEVHDLTASMSDLTGPGGAISASAVEVTYPRKETKGADWLNVKPFYTLDREPPAAIMPDQKTKVSLQPVWLKVRVPRDAKPGEYAGTLTVRFKIGIPDINLKDETPIQVPVHLKVHDWTLPEPREYRTFMDLIQSPETVAIRYQVPLWSDAHWKLLEPSLRLLGEIGDRSVYVRMINRSHLGDTQTWVRYVRQGDGTFRPDFAVLDRYLDLFEKLQGKPSVIVLYVWCRYTARGQAPLVSELDPKTGEVREMEAPKFGTPEGKAFWGPVFAAIREHLAKRGLDKALMIGITGDFAGIGQEMVDFFKEVAPGTSWVSQGHGARSRVGDVPVGFMTTVWNARGPVDPLERRSYGWRGAFLGCQFPRDICFTRDLIAFRTAPEWNITGGQRGMGRLGGDIWEVLSPQEKPRTGRHHAGGSLVNRFPQLGDWGQLVVRTCFLAPGREGAISTVMFEALREAVQDCEARISIEEALLDDARRAQLGDDLAARAQAVLDERTWMIAHAQTEAHWFFSSGFLGRQDKLYATAAEVARPAEIHRRDTESTEKKLKPPMNADGRG